MLIDSGSNVGEIIDHIRRSSLCLKAILVSHAHFDHVEGICEIKNAFHAPVYMHSEDKKLLARMNLFRVIFDKENPVAVPEVDFDLSSISKIEFDTLSLEVIHSPGHTHGGVCFRYGSHLFAGDTLMKGKVGRTDLPGSNKELLKESIEKLLELPDEVTVYPGHGEIFNLGDARREKASLAV